MRFKRFAENRKLACDASVIMLSNCDFSIYGRRTCKKSHTNNEPKKTLEFIQLTALLEIFNCDFQLDCSAISHQAHLKTVCILNKSCVWRTLLLVGSLSTHVSDKLKCESVDCHLFGDRSSLQLAKKCNRCVFCVSILKIEIENTVQKLTKHISHSIKRAEEETCMKFIILFRRNFCIFGRRRKSDIAHQAWRGWKR